jgi:hypothetical protein
MDADVVLNQTEEKEHTYTAKAQSFILRHHHHRQ